MDRRKLQLNALRAFEAAARHRSFSRAAEELCVTHSAVSHQVKQLEEQLGLALFARSNRGVRLTGAGETLLPVLGESLDRIAGTLEGLVRRPHGRALNVTTTPSFAAKWLMPRLGRWRAAAGTAEIHLVPTLEMLDLAGSAQRGRGGAGNSGGADLGVRCGLPPWPGLAAEFLLPIHMSPVCSPALLASREGLSDPRELLELPLIHADVAGHPLGEEWRSWLAAAGVADCGELQGLSFHDPGLALQAAIDGLGVAIGYRELAEPDLAAGRLLRPFDLALRHAFSYYLVYPAGRAEEPVIAAFRDWILAETGEPGAAPGRAKS